MTLPEIREAVSVALEAIRLNFFRSLLTTIGIAIGTLFVCLMAWLLYGLDTSLNRTIASLGSDMLYADKWDWTGRTRWTEVRSRKDITYWQARAVIEGLRTAEFAVPLVWARGARISAGPITTTDAVVTGTLSLYGKTPSGTTAAGRFFSLAEDRSATPVAVLGYKVAQQLFPKQNPLGKLLHIAGIPFTVIGVVEQQGTIFSSFEDEQIFIPLPMFVRLFGLTKRSFVIAVKAGSEERLELVRHELRGVMRRVRGLAPEAPDDFSINEAQAFREQIAGLRQAVWGTGISMSMLSFVVGIIGIVNIMFVSVAERTYEIGLRKAVGARRRSIALQFLIESALLCLVGASAALAIGNAIALLVRAAIPGTGEFLTPYIPPHHMGIALVVASTAGIIAGWAPAMRAARLHPIVALRHE